MITLDEYDRVQVILGRKGKPRPQKHEYLYSGFIKCAICKAAIVGDPKTKFIKSTGEIKTYHYYHCSRRKKGVDCSQRHSIKEEELNNQFETEISKFTILPKFRDWAIEVLNESHDKEIEERNKIYESQQKTILTTQKELDNLTQMRYKDIINDDEYMKERTLLQNKITELRQLIKDTESRADEWLELTEKTFDFTTYARIHFQNGDMKTKKEILQVIGSNPLLLDGKVFIEPNKWLQPIAENYPELEARYRALELNKDIDSTDKVRLLQTIRVQFLGCCSIGGTLFLKTSF